MTYHFQIYLKLSQTSMETITDISELNWGSSTKWAKIEEPLDSSTVQNKFKRPALDPRTRGRCAGVTTTWAPAF